MRLEEQLNIFLEDADPEATLEVGADMRKIQHCFQRLKCLGKELKPGLQTENGLPSPDPHGADIMNAEKKLREIVQQRDNEINILVNMLKKEKTRAQDAIRQINSENFGKIPPPSAQSSKEFNSRQGSRRFSESGFSSNINSSGSESTFSCRRLGTHLNIHLYFNNLLEIE
ncbi:hypothetical protein scyTo_0004294 [Scyliorhinus torazame]|uniref:Uncharacterized protein n=1 Tax=Scyliorhinus torazame TaxID=75743 RepID=A0A401NPA2_SCYTO|nr:hypothetical protein [Scyliorhinus torazame]